jgi:DNA transformation protein
MSVSEEFLSHVLDQLTGWEGVMPRKMFGGVGLFRSEKMFGLIADDVVYLKVDDSNRSSFETAGCFPFKPYSDKPARRSYYSVPPEVLENPTSFIEWADRSLAVQFKNK